MLQARKLEKLEEMEGAIIRDEEEEPEGKVVAGPSGEAVVYSSGNIPLFPFFHVISSTCLPLTSWLILLTDESDEEEEVVTGTKEEQELGVVQSWMEVGGLPTLPEEEAQGLLCEVFPFLFFYFLQSLPVPFIVFTFNFSPCDRLHFLSLFSFRI